MNNGIISPENLVYAGPEPMNSITMHYCLGCSHGVVHKLVAEVITEIQMEEKTVGVCPVGCAVFAYHYLGIDWQEAPRRRAPAAAVVVKRLWPDRLVFTYQGDGDLACVGTAESIHALNKGENVVMIFVDNAIYDMTDDQMASTILLGQETSTCPYGRDPELHGYPLNIAELASRLEETYYVTRQSIDTVASIRQAKKAVKKAFTASMEGKGSSFVEVVGACSSGWRVSSARASKQMCEDMFGKYSKGDLEDNIGLQPNRKKQCMKAEIIIPGFDGQSVLSMGKILTYSGLVEEKEVTRIPVYGPGQRDGTVSVMVIAGDKRISSPILSEYDVAIVLNQPSLDKFQPKMKPGGILIYGGNGIADPSSRTDIQAYRIGAIEQTTEMKNTKMFNITVLGGLLEVRFAVGTDGLQEVLCKSLPKRHHHMIPLNMQAVNMGIELITKQR